MKKSLLLLGMLSLFVGASACTTDHSETSPLSQSLILANYFDSTPVDVTGIWKLNTDSLPDTHLILVNGSATFLESDKLKKQGEISSEHCNYLNTKFYGKERLSPIYPVRISSRHVMSLGVMRTDTLFVGDNCDPDVNAYRLHGTYVRMH
jgi:hypothetical protein